MKDLRSLLRPSVARMGIKRQVEAAGAVEAFDSLKEEVLGGELASRVKALYIRNGVLSVSSSSSVAASELRMREADLLAVLAERLGEASIKKIRCVM